MQSTRHDPTVAALQAGAGLAERALDVVVLTADPGLLATMRDASGAEHAIWHAASADAAVDFLVGGRCSILIADLGTLRGDSVALLERLHSQFPELILIATGRRDEAGAVAALVSCGRIYRYLHKPISPARARLFIAAATRRYHELRLVEPLALTTVRTLRAGSSLPRILAAALALTAVTAVILWTGREKPSAAVPGPARISGPTREQQIAEQLGRAEIAYAAGRLSAPRGHNAVAYFQAVLALQPDHPQAKAGIDRVAMALEAQVIKALQNHDVPLGASTLTALQQVQPDHPRLSALRTELLTLSRNVQVPSLQPARRPATHAAEPVEPPLASVSQPSSDTAPGAGAAAAQHPGTSEIAAVESAAPAAPTEAELAAVTRLRGQGALTEPAGSSAYDQFITLRERYPQSDELRREQQQLAFALLERARAASAAGDLEDAAVSLNRVETLVPGMAATKALQDDLAQARERRDFMIDVIPAATLKRVREVPPVYPWDAQRAGVEGWVDVEFTIVSDGTLQDLLVRDAQPMGVFEKAALDSLQKWRFAPIVKNGAPAAQRAALRVRFKLSD